MRKPRVPRLPTIALPRGAFHSDPCGLCGRKAKVIHLGADMALHACASCLAVALALLSPETK